VELYEQIRREYEHGAERSAQWRGSWEFIGGRCAGFGHAMLRIGKNRNGSAPDWLRRYVYRRDSGE